MQSLILISDSDRLTESIKRQGQYFIIHEIDKVNLNLEKGDERFYITRMDNGIEEYETNEITFIRTIFQEKKVFFYLLCYTSETGMREFVNCLSFGETVLIFRSPCIYGKNRVSFSIGEPAGAGFRTAGAARLPADSGV